MVSRITQFAPECIRLYIYRGNVHTQKSLVCCISERWKCVRRIEVRYEFVLVKPVANQNSRVLVTCRAYLSCSDSNSSIVSNFCSGRLFLNGIMFLVSSFRESSSTLSIIYQTSNPVSSFIFFVTFLPTPSQAFGQLFSRVIHFKIKSTFFFIFFFHDFFFCISVLIFIFI